MEGWALIILKDHATPRLEESFDAKIKMRKEKLSELDDE